MEARPGCQTIGMISPWSSLFHLKKKKAVNADGKHGFVLAAALSLESPGIREGIDMEISKEQCAKF